MVKMKVRRCHSLLHKRARSMGDTVRFLICQSSLLWNLVPQCRCPVAKLASATSIRLVSGSEVKIMWFHTWIPYIVHDILTHLTGGKLIRLGRMLFCSLARGTCISVKSVGEKFFHVRKSPDPA
jgi:hypothetical protein